ncbi:MAG: hypothetical protein Q8P46_00245 [Hyphomicrobiales bacterium]|nr:hypothetical protein [Hyphomicrobiales bacterium]
MTDLTTLFAESTPEQKAAIARRTLCMATKILILTAKGNGVTDDRLKQTILALRSPELDVLRNEEAAELIRYLELAEA